MDNKPSEWLLHDIGECLRDVLSSSAVASEHLQAQINDHGDSSLKESISMIRHSQFLLLLIAQRIGDIANTYQESGLLPMAVTDVDRLASNLISTISLLVGSPSLTITYQSAIHTLQMPVYPIRLERLLSEMVSYCILRTPNTKNILVSLTSGGENAVFTVADNGGACLDSQLAMFNADGYSVSLTETSDSRLCAASAASLAQALGGTLSAVTSADGLLLSASLPIKRQGAVTLCDNIELYGQTAMGRLLTSLADVLDYHKYDSPYL